MREACLRSSSCSATGAEEVHPIEEDTMRHRGLGIVFGMLLVLTATANAVANDCVMCNGSQQCVPWNPNSIIPPGTGCDISYSGGQQWCQWETNYNCDSLQPLSPEALTGAGTLTVAITTERNTIRALSCNGFIMGHGATRATSAPVVLTL